MKCNKWIDVNEANREYFFVGNVKIKLNNVVRFKIDNKGTHYLETKGGEKAIVMPNWLYVIIDSPSWSNE